MCSKLAVEGLRIVEKFGQKNLCEKINQLSVSLKKFNAVEKNLDLKKNSIYREYKPRKVLNILLKTLLKDYFS
ncbi:MAG: hypothetical protein RR540_02455 [Oscillospiraceae bacterium]